MINKVVPILLLVVLLLSSCARPTYEFTKVRKIDNAEVFLKYNICTGSAWYYSHPSWIEIKDEIEIPKSTYIVKGKANAKGGWSLYRLDRITGDTWISVGNKWKQVADDMTKINSVKKP